MHACTVRVRLIHVLDQEQVSGSRRVQTMANNLSAPGRLDPLITSCSTRAVDVHGTWKSPTAVVPNCPSCVRACTLPLEPRNRRGSTRHTDAYPRTLLAASAASCIACCRRAPRRLSRINGAIPLCTVPGLDSTTRHLDICLEKLGASVPLMP
jgi:hypothetical protein